MNLFRLDRLITVGVVDPVMRARDRLQSLGCQPLRGARSLPILMYHSVSEDKESGRGSYYRICTAPALFREHLRILKEEGFAIVDLSSAVAALKSRVDPDWNNHDPAKSQSPKHRNRLAAITFDDGFRDFFTEAWPVLCEFGFAATVFLPTRYIGRERCSFNGRECLTWNEVRELRRQGVQFGSHSVTHPTLTELDDSSFEREFRDSKETIEGELGESIDTFSHPYAFPSENKTYIQRFREALENCRYRTAVTTMLGRAEPDDDPLLLKRLPVNNADDVRLFRAKLHGGYDWVEIPQRVAKRVKLMVAN